MMLRLFVSSKTRKQARLRSLSVLLSSRSRTLRTRSKTWRPRSVLCSRIRERLRKRTMSLSCSLLSRVSPRRIREWHMKMLRKNAICSDCMICNGQESAMKSSMRDSRKRRERVKMFLTKRSLQSRTWKMRKKIMLQCQQREVTKEMRLLRSSVSFQDCRSRTRD